VLRELIIFVYFQVLLWPNSGFKNRLPHNASRPIVLICFLVMQVDKALTVLCWLSYILFMDRICHGNGTLDSHDCFASCLMCFVHHCLWCADAGHYCEINIDECASNPCANNGTCTDLIAGYICTCPTEYVDDTCATPYCSANDPCSNGGTCHGAGLCSCLTGYSGSIRLTAYESYSFNSVYEIN